MHLRISIKSLHIIIFLSTLLGTSCVSPKKIIYFQGNDSIRFENNNYANYSPTYSSNDLLSIVVSGIEPEVIKPFNPFVSEGEGGVYSYLIDEKGMINFPIIGQLKIAGLNRTETSNLIKDSLKQYIKNPVVDVRILNFKITILGEISSPGVYTIPNDKITIIEAIGLARDLKITGLRDNILVIRDEKGVKKEFRVDLTSKEVFNSPVYYLHPNDIIYVEPNRGGMSASAYGNTNLLRSNLSLFTSVITSIVTLLVLFSIKK